MKSKRVFLRGQENIFHLILNRWERRWRAGNVFGIGGKRKIAPAIFVRMKNSPSQGRRNMWAALLDRMIKKTSHALLFLRGCRISTSSVFESEDCRSFLFLNGASWRRRQLILQTFRVSQQQRYKRCDWFGENIDYGYFNRCSPLSEISLLSITGQKTRIFSLRQQLA